MRDLIKKLWSLSKENPKGFTVTIPDLKPVTSGWAIGVKSTQNSHGLPGLRRVVSISLDTTKVVGGWKGYNGKFYFDTVIITHDFEEAKNFKKENRQLAIYNIETGQIF